jgi:hypothetical protein
MMLVMVTVTVTVTVTVMVMVMAMMTVMVVLMKTVTTRARMRAKAVVVMRTWMEVVRVASAGMCCTLCLEVCFSGHVSTAPTRTSWSWRS